MSILTDFLKLFKYDPETEGKSTFNITKSLNENWDKIEANAKLVSQTLEQKADKMKIIGGNNNTILIGEVTNYANYKGFELLCMLDNFYQTANKQLVSAFMQVGIYSNSYPTIDGKFLILNNQTAENATYKTKIQITDTGKIYAINSQYMSSCSWNIINKSDNVVIYDNPTVVSSINGNVIWDSELNKTTLATTDKIDNLWSGNVNLSTTPQNITVTKSIKEYNYLELGFGGATTGNLPVSTDYSDRKVIVSAYGSYPLGDTIHSGWDGSREIQVKYINDTTIQIYSSANISLLRQIRAVKVGG